MASLVSREYRMGHIHAKCSKMADIIMIFNRVNVKNEGKWRRKSLHACMGRMKYTPLTRVLPMAKTWTESEL
jgi:hypothetical protein